MYVARSLEMCFFFFCDLRELARKLPSPFGHPKASLYASSTYGCLRLFARPFGRAILVRALPAGDPSVVFLGKTLNSDSASL